MKLHLYGSWLYLEHFISGVYGLKSDIHDVTKHVEVLSLRDLLDGSYQYPSLRQDKGKKAANTNENLCFRCHACNLPISDTEFSMSGVYPYHKTGYKEQYHPKVFARTLLLTGSILAHEMKHAWLRLKGADEWGRGQHFWIVKCINNIFNRSIKLREKVENRCMPIGSNSSIVSRTDCNEGDNCRAHLASSSTVSREKDTCIASNTLPLCQPKEIWECLALPPAKSLDSLLLDISRPVLSMS
ncbi:hypothetical protein FRX31_008958 [Thalictrum thalictroides]|uniref:Protein DA1-like domain-containing protein n=1 Tax=Thalictrum thalictroides TaxID=46969 RepID=A0A7J6WY37_THATH|nr:hypothetical protein FRX31_008958 [Thalictrum thalictroides]